MRKRARRCFRNCGAIILISAIAWFLGREASNTWSQTRADLARLPADVLLACVGLLVLAALIETLIWHRLLRTAVGSARRLTFGDSFAVVNSTALGKYLPGKVWNYAWQAVILSQRGIAAQATISVNALVFIGSCTAACLVGAALGSWNRPDVAMRVVLLSAVLIGVGSILLVPLMHKLLPPFAARLAKKLKLDLSHLDVSYRTWCSVVLSYCLVWMVHGSAGSLLAIALHPDADLATVSSVVSAMALGWLIGTLVIIVPGGLGVREGAMVMTLGSQSGSLALLLPLVTRMLMIVGDVLLAGAATAIVLARRASRPGGSRIDPPAVASASPDNK